MSKRPLGGKGRGKERFKGNFSTAPAIPSTSPANLDTEATVTIGGMQYVVNATDLEFIAPLGHGAFGTVEKRRHRQTGTLMAVKQIPCTINSSEQTLKELDVSKRTECCPFIVHFYGALFKEGAVWLCMEVMDISLAKLYKLVFDSGLTMTYELLGVIATSVLKALHYLKSQLNVIHRDIKPSNILVNRSGQVKICDFGISGHLVDSKARTQVGCEMYMAPERVHDAPQDGYDIRSDVWSFGITMMELATGKFPYQEWKTPFDQINQVVKGDPPRLPAGSFPPEFCDFIAICLQKDYHSRPKYDHLLQHPFITFHTSLCTDISPFVTEILIRSNLISM